MRDQSLWRFSSSTVRVSAMWASFEAGRTIHQDNQEVIRMQDACENEDNWWTREGNGTPLQYSCLENPMDGGAWWAAVHGVAESRTHLSKFTLAYVKQVRKCASDTIISLLLRGATTEDMGASPKGSFFSRMGFPFFASIYSFVTWTSSQLLWEVNESVNACEVLKTMLGDSNWKVLYKY